MGGLYLFRASIQKARASSALRRMPHFGKVSMLQVADLVV
jgi:hypothetical protein